jgi:uncharacterized protein YdaU (DUF1376 family)
MKLYVADYHGDTTHLGALEHGAYLLLLMAMWRAGGKLPVDDAKLAKLAKVSPDQWAEIRPTILDFFRRRGGQISHKRISEEMAKYETVSLKRKAASEMGVIEKRNKNNAKAQPSGLPNADHLVTKPEPEPEKKEVEANASVGSNAPTKLDPWGKDADFQAAWTAVTPAMRSRAKSRAKVWPEWQKAKVKAGGGDVLLSAIRRYLANDPDVHRTSGPGLQRWLADGRWEHWLGDAPSAGALFSRDPALRRNSVY